MLRWVTCDKRICIACRPMERYPATCGTWCGGLVQTPTLLSWGTFAWNIHIVTSTTSQQVLVKDVHKIFNILSNFVSFLTLTISHWISAHVSAFIRSSTPSWASAMSNVSFTVLQRLFVVIPRWLKNWIEYLSKYARCEPGLKVKTIKFLVRGFDEKLISIFCEMQLS